MSNSVKEELGVQLGLDSKKVEPSPSLMNIFCYVYFQCQKKFDNKNVQIQIQI